MRDEAPTDDAITDYDRMLFVTYLLDAEGSATGRCVGLCCASISPEGPNMGKPGKGRSPRRGASPSMGSKGDRQDGLAGVGVNRVPPGFARPGRNARDPLHDRAAAGSLRTLLTTGLANRSRPRWAARRSDAGASPVLSRFGS